MCLVGKIHSLVLVAVLLGAGSASAFETVVIDPGHGGNDEGTKWYHVREKDLTLAVAKRLERVLQIYGVNTMMTRRYNTYVSLDERSEMANRVENSLLLSIHFNASSAQFISGFESFYDFQTEGSRNIAASIQQSLAESIPSRSRGVTKQDFAVLVRTTGCAVLIECGFISNKAEGQRYATPEGQQALAEAIARGVVRIKPIINYDLPTSMITLGDKPRKKSTHNLPVDNSKKTDPVKKVAVTSAPAKTKKKKT